MNLQYFDPAAEHIVTVTEKATAHFKRQLQADSAVNAVRLSVKESGCTGFMYVLDLAEKPEPTDLPIHCDNDFTLFVEKGSEPIIRGLTVDYITEGVNHQIKFLNPNAKNYCGCGESFSVK